MSRRPYILLSCAMSIDGFIDDMSAERLLLSTDTDFDRVDEVRANCDAIMVGAATIRKDNPRLLVRSESRRQARITRGLPLTPIKVTITGRGDLDPGAQFFTVGDTEKIVYAARGVVDAITQQLGGLATVVDAGDPVDLTRLLHDLADRGVGTLLVEGGGTIYTQFLTAGLADELHLVVAPIFVGDATAPRFVYDGKFPWNRDHQAKLAETVAIDNLILLRYALSDRYGTM